MKSFAPSNEKSSSPKRQEQQHDLLAQGTSFQPHSHPASLSAQLIQLQRSIGNRAVTQLAREQEISPQPSSLSNQQGAIQKKGNNTGLPDSLKGGLEQLSGFDLSDVRVHYHSPKPAEIDALAYAQGSEIYLGPGQERHLPHEAWHVVQQKQGRVRPTLQMKSGLPVNDEASLEKEADTMGAKALQTNNRQDTSPARSLIRVAAGTKSPVQGVWATVSGTSGRINLKTLKDQITSSGSQLYKHSKTGQMYEFVNVSGSGLEVKPYVPQTSGSSFSSRSVVHDVYKDWTPTQKTNLSVDTAFGPVSARHNRGAPYITSKEGDYGNAKLGTSYSDFAWGLRGGSNQTNHDAEIAQALLDFDTTTLKDDLQLRAAAMLDATVYLAEEWRKQGASKIFRSLLRQVADGSKNLNEAFDQFLFIDSAKDGRKQVGRFQDYLDGEIDYDDLDEEEQDIVDYMSQVEDDDFSSDDDMREDKKLKSKRLFAKKYN